ncbi:MAG: S9 family peptidase [Planctomycetota bacterium]|jgi:dipeptidyl-peptidase-4
MRRYSLFVVLSVAMLALLAVHPAAADGLEDLPGWDRYQRMRRAGSLASGGTVRSVSWSADGGSVTFSRDGEWFTLDLQTLATSPATAPERGERNDRGRRRGPARGRQRKSETSPDGSWEAISRNWNVTIERTDDSGTSVAVTTDGTRKHRFGEASWVYGEELDQTTAMWWSPDSRYLVFYGFDEREVPDYFLLSGLTDLRTGTMVEGYPKPGDPNPIATLMIHDVEHGTTRAVDTGDHGAEATGHYVYNTRFTPDGTTILFNRTNRHQSVLEVVAVDPSTAATRVVIRESQDAWQRNSPMMRYLEDGQRFVWETERNGFRQYELRSLDGTRIAEMTAPDSQADGIVKIDEARELLYYRARSGANPLESHLHRASFDGSIREKLTEDGLNYSSAHVSPDDRWIIVTGEDVDSAPVTTLHDRDGTFVASIAESDTSQMHEFDVSPPEIFSFTAEDGVTTVYGVLYKPSDFDPNRTYPLVIDVYGGPHTQRVRNTFSPGNALAELGMLVAIIDNRGTGGRGKVFESATYQLLGSVDLQDQADGVRHLRERSYVDGDRVGIYGHSYGGYMSALAILKHPDVFTVAVAGAPVTDWRNYDTIYTERYMRTPAENEAGYDAGSCMTYADQLEGHLLIMHGMVDDNVHPNNAWQLVNALHRAGKRFDMMFYPNSGHGLGRTSSTYRLEYLAEHLLQ